MLHGYPAEAIFSPCPSATASRAIDRGGDDRVVALRNQVATGKGSSAQVEWHQGQIWELKDGRVIRTRNYPNPADALEAAGLTE